MCFNLGKMTVPIDNRSVVLGTILIFNLFVNNVRTTGPIGMGEALIDVFRPREDDGAY